MSDTPETIAAILAEMRDLADHRAADAGGERPGIELLRSYADRLEAAAERERQDAMKQALLAKCKVCEKVGPASAPGNAAAIRDALEKAHNNIKKAREFIAWQTREDELLMEAQQEIKTALAAPARNCDRFKTAVDAMEEWNKYPQSRYKGCRMCPHGDASMVSPAHLTLAEWLYVAAEGGAE